jgi:hypothetical protein
VEWLIVGVVAAAIVTPFVLVVLLVRWFDRLRAPRLRRPVDGSLQVEQVSSPTQSDVVPTAGDLLPSHEDFTLSGMLTGPTLAAPLRVQVRDAAWTNRWPRPGDSIPVVYDRDDPRTVQIRRDQPNSTSRNATTS